MKTERPWPAFTVTPKAEAALLRGHPWVYDAEILSAPEQMENGGIADVRSRKGAYLGTALYSERSKIRLRLVTRNANDRLDQAFWERKLRWAWDYRKTVLFPEDLDACRVIFGEADAFPGLTVDKFHDLLSVQILSCGMERLRDLILPLLVRVLREDGQAVRGVYLRNDAAIRDKEGLPREKGWYVPPREAPSVPAGLSSAAPPETGGQSPEEKNELSAEGGGLSPVTVITENGILYQVDVENGQKTGFFLDQKFNRRSVARLAAGKTVLDCFTHTGSFALNAARGGAVRVTAVDASEAAVEMARANAARNGLSDRVSCVQADVFQLLPRLEREGADYDFIILDPPAFTKSRRTADSAMAGYKEINLRAMRLLPRGGYLATCSCSHFAGEERFVSMLRAAAFDARVQLRQIEASRQSPDHPILWGVEETEYLKFYLFQVV